MKRILLMCVMVVTIGTLAGAQSRHRHQHRDTVVTEQQNETTESISAYSDTASYDDETVTHQIVVTDNGNNRKNIVTDENRFDPSRFTDPFSYYAALWTSGLGGVLIALFIMLIILTFIALPFIFILVIFRFLLKRHNDRIALAEKAIESGNQMQNKYKGLTTYSDTIMHSKGIRNISIGVGLVLMFLCWNAKVLVGIGFLVLCLGIGQVFIARTTNVNEDSRNIPEDIDKDEKSNIR